MPLTDRPHLELANDFLRARFDPATGNLLGVLPIDEMTPIVGQAVVTYRENGGGASRVHSESSGHPLAKAPQVVAIRRSRGMVSSVLRTPHLEIRRRFQVSPASPLLRIHYVFVARTSAKLNGPGLLYLDLATDLNDVACDEKDLYFDGAELGGRRELPCWRVLYRRGHRRGVLVATRSKRMMSRLMYLSQGLEIRPHVYAQQQVDNALRDIPIDIQPGMKYEVAFEIGPWRAGHHDALIAAAGLDRPERVKAAPLSKVRPALGPGRVFWLADWVPSSAVADTFEARRWLRLALPGDARRKALVVNSGCRPPAFVVRPDMQGPCRVIVHGSKAASVGLHFSGDPYPMHRYGIGGTAFHSVLHDEGQGKELDFGVVDMTDRNVRIIANHNGHWPARLDCLRIEPLSPADAQAWRQRQPGSLPLLAGIPDCGDVFFNLMDRHRLDARIIKGNLWEQARAGFTRVYWQMHGTYTGFHTRIGTRLPMVCRGHGAFEPQIKAAVLFQRKHDLLALAAETCRELGMECWGAMRMNAYMSGKRDRFFEDHPHYAEITEDGTLSGNKICYAIPQVRQYHRSILVEAARYGLQGILLGTLRHPPLLLYHPALVSGYRARFGRLPPREPGRADPFHHHSLPRMDDEHRQWYAYRAGFMTDFVRELKHDLREQGLGHVKISAWLRPNHCLFDGIDLETWLREKLCDEVVCDLYVDPLLEEPSADWRKMVQTHVPLIRGIGFDRMQMDVPAVQRVLGEGYDGLCAYGSEQFAQNPANQPLLEILNGRMP